MVMIDQGACGAGQADMSNNQSPVVMGYNVF